MKKSVLLGALLALPFAAAAEGLSYNYAELNWVADTELETNGGSADGDGFDLGGVFSINENLYILGNYEDVTYDGNGGDLDLTTIAVGVGFHSNTYTGSIDVFGNLTFEDLELDVAGFSADGNGFGLEIGARTELAENLDGFIAYQYKDVDDLEVNYFSIGGTWSFNPNWGVALEYRTGEYKEADLDRDDIRLGLRYNF